MEHFIDYGQWFQKQAVPNVDPRKVVCKDLLTYLSQLRSTEKLWMALPREINRWWRARSQMKLISDGGRWRIEGPEAERARIAYARLENEHLVYRIENHSLNQ
jgi:hypothetical protein